MVDGPASTATLESTRRGELLAHLPEPDYTRPLLTLSAEQRQRMLDLLGLMYGPPRPSASSPNSSG